MKATAYAIRLERFFTAGHKHTPTQFTPAVLAAQCKFTALTLHLALIAACSLQECFLLLVSPEAYTAVLGKASASALAGAVLQHVAGRGACR